MANKISDENRKAFMSREKLNAKELRDLIEGIDPRFEDLKDRFNTKKIHFYLDNLLDLLAIKLGDDDVYRGTTCFLNVRILSKHWDKSQPVQREDVLLELNQFKRLHKDEN